MSSDIKMSTDIDQGISLVTKMPLVLTFTILLVFFLAMLFWSFLSGYTWIAIASAVLAIGTLFTGRRVINKHYNQQGS